jgi:probable HAF family extracellular repeat protein
MSLPKHAATLGLAATILLVGACADQSDPAGPAGGIDAAGATFSSIAQTNAVVVVGPYTITITDLGLLPGGTYASGYTINNPGLVAGMAYNSSGALERVLWNNGVMTTIPNFDPSATLVPVKLNDGGHMIMDEPLLGISVNYAIWREPNGTLHQLPPFPGGDPLRVSGRSINNPGLLVGMVREQNLAPTQHGVIWQNGAFLQDMGGMAGFSSTDPRDINDLGQIVGTSINVTNFNRTAFLWQGGNFTNLGALAAGAASGAMAINNTGTIVGTSNGGFPVRWVNGAIQSLPVPAGVIQPTPVDVNDAGDIIGWGTSSAPGVLYASAFWRNGQPILLPAWPGATQTLARSINNNAEIVGEGPLVPGGPQHALKWTITTGTPGNTLPVVTLAATTTTTIRVGGRVSMRGTFTDPDNGPWNYTWIWSNGRTTGTTATAGAITATRTYTSRGTFNVRLIVADAQGGADTSNTIKVTVR